MTLDSEMSGGTSQPTPMMRKLQARYAPESTQWNEQRNELGDYTQLVKQMNENQQQLTVNDSFIISTLDSRRTVDKLADDTTDGYNMLANTFGGAHQSAINHKKSRKSHVLSQQTM